MSVLFLAASLLIAVQAYPLPQNEGLAATITSGSMPAAAFFTATNAMEAVSSPFSTDGLVDVDFKSDTANPPDSDNGDGFPRKLSVQYIMVICGCVIIALVCAGGLMRWSRVFSRRNRAALYEINDMLIEAQQQGAQRKKRSVLDQSQFDLLPHSIAKETVTDRTIANSTNGSEAGADRNSVNEHVVDLGNSRNTESQTPEQLMLSKQPESCSICLSDVVPGDQLVYLVPCYHGFHVDCAGPWLMKKSTLCPLCKTDVAKGLGLSDTPDHSDSDHEHEHEHEHEPGNRNRNRTETEHGIEMSSMGTTRSGSELRVVNVVGTTAPETTAVASPHYQEPAVPANVHTSNAGASYGQGM
ncbi:hypothetical protein GGI07_002159 [Coemansia sp. Benny D115]|nr:hypothetical protein GGI07_002159 [Coemansia sp. Benny D115]